MTSSEERQKVIAQFWRELQQVRPDSRILIAIDGFDGAGKTHLSEELAECAETVGGRALVRVSIDGFHRPRAERRAAGDGPDGFYRGSYRYAEFRRCVAEPLRQGHPITPAIWDVAKDESVSADPVVVPPRGVVLVDGIFLHRPELVDIWDATVWVDVPFAISVPRGNARFAGSHDPDPEAPSNRRYVQGQRLYLQEADPRSRADWIFDNADLAAPHLRRRPLSPSPSPPPSPSICHKVPEFGSDSGTLRHIDAAATEEGDTPGRGGRAEWEDRASSLNDEDHMTGRTATGAPRTPKPPKPVQAALTASEILEGLAAAGGQSSLTQLVERTGIPLGTIHRMLQALAQQGYIRQDPETRLYALGPSLIRIGGMSGRLLGSWTRPILTPLVEATGETATMSLLDGADIVYVAQVPSPHNLRMLTELGRRIPAASTAAGKALLSLLDDDQVRELFARHPLEAVTRRTIVDPEQFLEQLAVVRAQGYAVEDGEQELGVRAFAMPVRGERPMAVAVSGPDTRLSGEEIVKSVPVMTEVVAQLEAEAARH